MNTNDFKTMSQHYFSDYVYIKVGKVLVVSVIINSQLAKSVVFCPPCCMVRGNQELQSYFQTNNKADKVQQIQPVS